MNLFDETGNKYYEFIAYLLRKGSGRSKKEIENLAKEYLQGEQDFEVMEALFASEEENQLVFAQVDGKFEPILDLEFPIRNSILDNQAAKTLLSDSYIRHFLSAGTMEKLKAAVGETAEEWNPLDITVKNRFYHGDSSIEKDVGKALSVIADAVRNKKAVRYDNIRPGYVECLGAKAFPVKIEFSIVNDKFRVCAFEPGERRFIKMNLDGMRNVVLLEETADLNLQEEYQEYRKVNTKKVVLDVEPVDHVIERCFRVFSYYDRKARYDREENKYRLEISYMRTDENEVIKNILSMGSYVVVIEPRMIQKEVYRRILAASLLYNEFPR